VTIDRRTFLTAAVAAAAGLVAISCSDGGGGAAGDATSTTRTPTTEAPTEAPTTRPPDATSTPSTTSASHVATFVDTGPRDHDRIALTFHTNGDLDLAQQLLDVLTAHNVVMTSFIVGEWLDASPTWAKKITDAGHELANHTYTHPSFLTLSRDAMLDEVVRCRDVLVRLSGSPGAFFRPSGTDDGTTALPQVVLDVAGEAGYRTVLGFDVDPHDYEDPGADAVAQRTLAAVGPGSIVSLHFGHPGTIAAMPAILDGLVQKGLTPVHASQLLA
jgi:peptidoglycan/xylan/chitin deacetylase (PgdA/CDA1 family)